MINQPTITICETELAVKEFDGQRVVTFRDIDTLHRRPDGTARKRFHDNKNRFLEGTDFFKITPSEFRTAFGEMDARQQNDITLLTETGYLMLVKSFTDDLAWAVQRQLVNLYFRVTRQPAPIIPNMVVPPLQPESAAGVAQLVRALRAVMRDNHKTPQKIAQTIESICGQFGVELPPDFSEPSESDAPIDRRHARFAKTPQDTEDQIAACNALRIAVQDCGLSYAELSRETKITRSLLWRYANQLNLPLPKRARFLLKTLEPLIQPDDEQLAIDEL